MLKFAHAYDPSPKSKRTFAKTAVAWGSVRTTAVPVPATRRQATAAQTPTMTGNLS